MRLTSVFLLENSSDSRCGTDHKESYAKSWCNREKLWIIRYSRENSEVNLLWDQDVLDSIFPGVWVYSGLVRPGFENYMTVVSPCLSSRVKRCNDSTQNLLWEELKQMLLERTKCNSLKCIQGEDILKMLLIAYIDTWRAFIYTLPRSPRSMVKLSCIKVRRAHALRFLPDWKLTKRIRMWWNVIRQVIRWREIQWIR